MSTTITTDIIINHLKEMLIERGDDIEEFNAQEADMDRDAFYNDNSLIEFNTSNTHIVFALTQKLKEKVLGELSKLTSNGIANLVNRYNNKLNIIMIFNNDNISTLTISQLNRYDNLLRRIGGTLQYFHMKNLMFNPTRHQLVPRHIKMTNEEVTEMMGKYLIKNKIQLPYILYSDPIAKWLGLKQGDVIKIERYNENSGLSYYYRVCV